MTTFAYAFDPPPRMPVRFPMKDVGLSPDELDQAIAHITWRNEERRKGILREHGAKV